MKLYAKKTAHGCYIVNERGQAVDPNGEPVYHPYPCKEGDYPPYPGK